MATGSGLGMRLPQSVASLIRLIPCHSFSTTCLHQQLPPFLPSTWDTQTCSQLLPPFLPSTWADAQTEYILLLPLELVHSELLHTHQLDTTFNIWHTQSGANIPADRLYNATWQTNSFIQKLHVDHTSCECIGLLLINVYEQPLNLTWVIFWLVLYIATSSSAYLTQYMEPYMYICC